MKKTSSIRDKIKALKAKTLNAGCTEAEALAAAELAFKLMHQHQIEDADLDISEAEIAETARRAVWQARILSAISICTNTASVYVTNYKDGHKTIFVGREPGPQIALYLRDICFRAVKLECAKFRAGRLYKTRRNTATKRQATADFTHALTSHLAFRLVDIFKPLRDESIALQSAQALDKLFPSAKTINLRKHKQRYSEAGYQGHEAGRNIALNHSMTNELAPVMIGGA